MDIVVFGINHKTAELDVLEKCSFGKDELLDSARTFLADDNISETVILSTCNRVEVYAVVRNADSARDYFRDIFINTKNIKAEDSEKFYFYSVPDSVEHLFTVSSSIDSMVVGEAEILGQVKSAYNSAKENRTVGRVLDKLFQKAFTSAKIARSKTDIGRIPVSVSSLAVELACRIFENLSGKKAMIIGAGETARGIGTSLKSNGLDRIFVANRTLERAEELAGILGGTPMEFETGLKMMSGMDIVLVSSGAPHYLITADAVRKIESDRKQKPIFFIDVSVPRNVDPAVNQIDNVYLYNIDDLKTIADRNISERMKEVEKCRHIISNQVNEFQLFLDNLKIIPLIEKINAKYEEIRKEELTTVISRIKTDDEKLKREIDLFSQKITKEFLKKPIMKLTEYSAQDEKHIYADIIEKLFDIAGKNDKN